jgi:hypothetical protein
MLVVGGFEPGTDRIRKLTITCGGLVVQLLIQRMSPPYLWTERGRKCTFKSSTVATARVHSGLYWNRCVSNVNTAFFSRRERKRDREGEKERNGGWRSEEMRCKYGMLWNRVLHPLNVIHYHFELNRCRFEVYICAGFHSNSETQSYFMLLLSVLVVLLSGVEFFWSNIPETLHLRNRLCLQ